MIYSKKFKIIIISVIVLIVIGLLGIALVNRASKVSQMQAIAEASTDGTLESEDAYNELTSTTDDDNTKKNNNSSSSSDTDTNDLKSKIELSDYFTDISDEQIAKNEQSLQLLIGEWSSNQKDIPVTCTFTENTMTIHYAGDEYIQETTLVYKFEILDDTNMLIEDEDGNVTKEIYKLYNVGEKLYFEPPIKKYTSLYIKDDFVYVESTTETTTEEVFEDDFVDDEDVNADVLEYDFLEDDRDDMDEMESLIKEYKSLQTTENVVEDEDDFVDDEDVDDDVVDEDEDVEDVEDDTETTTKAAESVDFDEWLYDYLESE